MLQTAAARPGFVSPHIVLALASYRTSNAGSALPRRYGDNSAYAAGRAKALARREQAISAATLKVRAMYVEPKHATPGLPASLTVHQVEVARG